jgi:hypothetical protein
LIISHYSWTHSLDEEPPEYLISTAGALSSLPLLTTLVVEIEGWSYEIQGLALPPLRDFKNLCTLSVSCNDDIPRAYCLEEIAAAINASPSLANLSIRNLGQEQQGKKTCASLQSFLQTSRPELVQLDLRRVPLPSAGIREILSPKLQQLSISTPPSARRIEFDWRRLWSALQETGIELLILKVSGTENAMDEMFTYLLSYPGLQRLEIPYLLMDSQEAEDRAAQRFWDKIVPHHRNSLTTLSIESQFGSRWCYGPLAKAVLRQCLSLRDLTISVCNVNSSWAEATLSRAREYDKIEFRCLEQPYGALANCCVRPAENGVS